MLRWGGHDFAILGVVCLTCRGHFAAATAKLIKHGYVGWTGLPLGFRGLRFRLDVAKELALGAGLTGLSQPNARSDDAHGKHE